MMARIPGVFNTWYGQVLRFYGYNRRSANAILAVGEQASR
jgi:hypothetical protein